MGGNYKFAYLVLRPVLLLMLGPTIGDQTASGAAEQFALRRRRPRFHGFAHVASVGYENGPHLTVLDFHAVKVEKIQRVQLRHFYNDKKSFKSFNLLC